VCAGMSQHRLPRHRGAGAQGARGGRARRGETRGESPRGGSSLGEGRAKRVYRAAHTLVLAIFRSEVSVNYCSSTRPANCLSWTFDLAVYAGTFCRLLRLEYFFCWAVSKEFLQKVF